MLVDVTPHHLEQLDIFAGVVCLIAEVVQKQKADATPKVDGEPVPAAHP